MYRLTSHFIAQIIQAVETAAYRRMLVRIQLERSGYLTDVIISLVAGSAGKDKVPHPVRLRKEGSRNQTAEIGTVYSGWHRNYNGSGSCSRLIAATANSSLINC